MIKQPSQAEYIVSKRLADGTLIEAVIQPDGSTALVIARDGQMGIVERAQFDGMTYLPIPPHNNLLRHRVVLLPPLPAEPVDPLFPPNVPCSRPVDVLPGVVPSVPPGVVDIPPRV